MTEKRCPVMYPTDSRRNVAPGPLTISMSIAERAHSVYVQKYGKGQTLERMIERGGYHAGELDMYLGTGWRQEEHEIELLRAQVAKLQAEHDAVLQTIKDVGGVVVREGNGPVNLAASVAVTISKVRSKV